MENRPRECHTKDLHRVASCQFSAALRIGRYRTPDLTYGHRNMTTNPTAVWTLRQLRVAIPLNHGYRFLIRDRNGIFSPQLDQSNSHMGLRMLKTPPRSPTANRIYERVIESLRRECLDNLIPLGRLLVYRTVKQWVDYYKIRTYGSGRRGREIVRLHPASRPTGVRAFGVHPPTPSPRHAARTRPPCLPPHRTSHPKPATTAE